MSAAAAAFAAIDANHDGVVDQAEFAAAVAAPAVTYSSSVPVAAPANTYVINPTPITYAASPITYAAAPATSVIYGGSTVVPAAAPAGKVVTLMAGSRIVYESRTTGEMYPGSIVERNAGGWLIKLDVDGGVKEVADSDMWRVNLPDDVPSDVLVTGAETAEAAPAAAPVKAKKSKKVSKKSKGCC